MNAERRMVTFGRPIPWREYEYMVEDLVWDYNNGTMETDELIVLWTWTLFATCSMFLLAVW